VLVEHGDQDVMNRLAANPGARFLVADFGAMLGRASADDRARVLARQPVSALRNTGDLIANGTMLDISPGGAKLEFAAAADVPEIFTMEFTSVERKQLSCRAVWRRASIVGVRFAEPLIALWDPDYVEVSVAASA
jgi:hypothetical protein